MLHALREVQSSSRGEKVSREEHTAPRKETILREERFVSIGKLHSTIIDPTGGIKETEFQQFLPRRVELLVRSRIFAQRTGSWCGAVYPVVNISTYLNNIASILK